MKNPSPESWRGGWGCAREGTVPVGGALTTSRRVSVACMASAIAVVPVEATPVSDFHGGPRTDDSAEQGVAGDVALDPLDVAEVGDHAVVLLAERANFFGAYVSGAGDVAVDHVLGQR
jgi:hypothetical protein